MHRRFLLLLIIALPALAGCAARYHEPTAAASEDTFIEAVAPVWIVRIDGKAVPRVTLSGSRRLALTPGRHVIALRYSGTDFARFQGWHGEQRKIRVAQQSEGVVSVDLFAEKGRRYFAHAGVEGPLWQPYINESPPNAFQDLPR